MLVRFVTPQIDAQSQSAEGVFAAAGKPRRSAELSSEDAKHLKELVDWFDANLDKPNRFNRSRRPNRKNKAISWFKPSALELLRHLRDLAELLERYGRPVRMIKTHNPVYVIYEDEFQIVAGPFSTTGA